jgi:hypothetical protein
MTSRTKLGAVALLVLVLVASVSPRTASADEPPPSPPPPRFGERGQLVLGADRLMPLVSYTSQTITAVQGDTTTEVTDTGTSLAFLVGREPTLGAVHTVPRVAFDFTVLRNLTLGTSIAFAFGVGGDHTEERTPTVGPKTTRESRAPRSTLIGFAPRVGYVVALGSKLAFWPRAGFGFYSVTSKTEETSNLGVTSTTRVTDTLFSLDLDPQLVWLPLPHVLVHAGPLMNVPLDGSHETSFSQASDMKARTDDLSLFHLGVSAGLAVWFDL